MKRMHVYISLGVLLRDLAEELSDSVDKSDLIKFVTLLDAEVASPGFTIGLVEALAEPMGELGFAINITTIEESNGV